MSDKDYPQRLKLFKEEEKDQDHYFVIVDEEGSPINKSFNEKWYPILNGYLNISLSTLSCSNNFSQDGQRYSYTKDDEIEITQDEWLGGEGKFQEGTVNTFGSTNISHFGNSKKYNEIIVTIRGEDIEREHFSLFGFKSDVDVGFNVSEQFNLEIKLKVERFNDLKKIVMGGSVEKVYISIWLGNVPGLYSSWWSFEGSTFGDIKYFDYINPKHIINKEDFEEDFIRSLYNRRDPKLGSGIDFNISTIERVGSFPVTKTPYEKEQLELEKLWTDEKNEEEDDSLFTDTPLSTEEIEEIRRNQELNLEKQKVSTLLSIFWGVVVIGILLLLTLWFK